MPLVMVVSVIGVFFKIPFYLCILQNGGFEPIGAVLGDCFECGFGGVGFRVEVVFYDDFFGEDGWILGF